MLCKGKVKPRLERSSKSQAEAWKSLAMFFVAKVMQSGPERCKDDSMYSVLLYRKGNVEYSLRCNGLVVCCNVLAKSGESECCNGGVWSFKAMLGLCKEIQSKATAMLCWAVCRSAEAKCRPAIPCSGYVQRSPDREAKVMRCQTTLGNGLVWPSLALRRQCMAVQG